MARRPLTLRAADGLRLREGFAAIRAELGVPSAFPPEVTEAATRAAAQPLSAYPDLTDVPFVTIDPPGSKDLDQALNLERHAAGFRVRYAIADVAAFVRAGDPVDVEARSRGQTLYAPDGRTPLHPSELSEGAASLLPGVDRLALVWDLSLDSAGELIGVDVARALVRSRERLDYAGVQAQLDAGTAPDQLVLLREIGQALQASEQRRGGIDLPLPEQEIVEDGGHYRLELRMRRPTEGWNAQLSLLTGRAAAKLMLDGGVGILRTLPETSPEGVAQLRRAGVVLGVTWPEDASYAEVIRGVDPENPRHAAFVQQATMLLRGSGYTAFADGHLPEHRQHAGVAAPYAHVTAPLRRLVDRFAAECALALHAGQPVPDWVLAALPELPGRMAETDRRASALERACIDLVEAVVLADSVGREFDASVVDVRADYAMVQLADPPVRAKCVGADLPLGQRIRVRLESVSVPERTVVFVPV